MILCIDVDVHCSYTSSIGYYNLSRGGCILPITTFKMLGIQIMATTVIPLQPANVYALIYNYGNIIIMMVLCKLSSDNTDSQRLPLGTSATW